MDESEKQIIGLPVWGFILLIFALVFCCAVLVFVMVVVILWLTRKAATKPTVEITPAAVHQIIVEAALKSADPLQPADHVRRVEVDAKPVMAGESMWPVFTAAELDAGYDIGAAWPAPSQLTPAHEGEEAPSFAALGGWPDAPTEDAAWPTVQVAESTRR